MAADETHENGAAIAPDASTGPNASQDVEMGDGQPPKNRDRRGPKNQRGGRNNRKRDGGGAGRGGDERKRKDREDRPHFATKRRRTSPDGETPSYMNIQFTAEEIAAEDRRPKRKVAVLLGYAGTGYKGMQINHQEKTIEGDLFRAFVEAGAISKANASDPKKVSLMRCARTDKGVHAAANVVSLKLIVDDGQEAAVAARINENLPDQIRIWGIQRTNNSFSCYQACDSRWYEYLMPSHVLLPPHPDSYIGKKIVAAAKEKGEYEAWKAKLGDLVEFWEKVEENDIKPILNRLEPGARKEVIEKLHLVDEAELQSPRPSMPTAVGDTTGAESSNPADEAKPVADAPLASSDPKDEPSTDADANVANTSGYVATAADIAQRDVKAAYVAAKRRYRVTEDRIQQLQEALDAYVGTNNFHNYTVQKKFTDSSAKRHIKSFKVNPEPIQIGDTQWLSLKVHGQSFMMHQIRKMVAMAVLLVRSGTPLDRIKQSYGAKRISIPKAPGLGLLLERPVFDNYSQRATENLGRQALTFSPYEKEIQAFKDVHIYKRMWDVEEKENVFHTFLHQLDNSHTDYFLWVTAHGLDVAYERKERGERVPKALEDQLGSDSENPEEGDG